MVMAQAVETGGTIHVVQRMEPGGIQTLILDMLRAKNNPADRIFSLEADRTELIADWPQLKDFRDQLVGFSRGAGLLPSLAREIAARLRECRPNRVIVHHIGPMLYGSAAARLAGVRELIHVEHDVWHYENRRHRFISGVSSRLFRPSHVAVSHQVAEGMKPIIGNKKIAVIAPAIDTNRFVPRPRGDARDALGLSREISLIGSAGRMVEVKAYDLLIEALFLLPGEPHLVLAGDGPDRQALEALAQKLQIADRVHFLGLRSDLEKVIPALDIFCLSSHNEGLPRVVLEAQSCDIPVVATDVGALDEGVCLSAGRLVCSGDASALAKGLIEQLAAKVVPGECRQFVEQKYGLEHMMLAYDRVVEEG